MGIVGATGGSSIVETDQRVGSTADQWVDDCYLAGALVIDVAFVCRQTAAYGCLARPGSWRRVAREGGETMTTTDVALGRGTHGRSCRGRCDRFPEDELSRAALRATEFVKARDPA
ncbi:MAG: hypothetical protein HY308_09145 [Gammaproteobacteria bacterium]|nr:hypothetical protein [Gammaproteobacteria bacterium]